MTDERQAIRELHNALLDKINPNSDPFTLGTIVSDDGGGLCTVQFAGDDAPLPGIRRLKSATVTAGDIAMIIQNESDWVIIGVLQT